MTARPGPVYENRVFVEADSLHEYEAWATQQADRARDFPGVSGVALFAVGRDAADRAGRVCQFTLADDEALERFIDGPATDIEADAIERFGDRIEWHERILREDESRELPAGEMPECLNCGTRLRGQYCANCGQRASSRLISLWGLIRDAFGDLFELDSRLWRTLVPLMIRPGRLTHDYLQGRRARYMPPFRMYLVMSLLFFLVAFFDPRETLGILYEPQALETAEEERRREASEIADEVRRDLAAEGIITDPPGGEEQDEGAGEGLNIRVDGEEGATADCEVEDFSISGPAWLQRRLTPERLVHICEQIREDNGRRFLQNLYDNIPLALIVLLPIMAFVLKALYPLSRRYYVEHLLFFVHFHAFMFLMLTLQILISRLNTALPTPEALGILLVVATAFYVPVYLFIAMRRVYGQGRLVTAAKYVVLNVSYMAGFTVIMLAAVTMAAFSI